MDNSPPHIGGPLWASRRGRRFPNHQRYTPTPMSILMGPKPIQDLNLECNPQQDSPLYNGRIPPEVRDQIFAYAMSEYTKSDPGAQYPKQSDYTRPGYTGKRAITRGLLMACRRTYLETYHLPAVSKEHVFWHLSRPRTLPGDETRYFEQFIPWQMKLVKEIHLFTQAYWLEDSFFTLSQKKELRGIEKLTITLRRGDWWYNETNATLAINPQRSNADVEEMRQDWLKEKAGEVIPYRQDGWGSAFANMKSLKELVLELETSEDKVPELKEIVEKAMTWKFPMRNGLVLSAEGLPIKKTEWRSSDYSWSTKCPYCSGNLDCAQNGLPSAMTDKCKEKQLLRLEKLGPMCTIFTLRYKLAKGEGLR